MRRQAGRQLLLLGERQRRDVVAGLGDAALAALLCDNMHTESEITPASSCQLC